MESKTVLEIKTWAKANNYRFPSHLNKSDLIEYLNGLIWERENLNLQEDKLFYNYSDLINKSADLSIHYLDHLHKFGWAVVDIPNWDSSTSLKFLEWLSRYNPNFKVDNIKTWTNVPPNNYGVIKQYIAQATFLWEIRELCYPIFSEIWGTNDLLCSFDGANFSLPTSDTKFRQWFHTDQHRNDLDFISVQGVVNFLDTDGGLVILENSHLVFEEYMKTHPSSNITWGRVKLSDPLLKDLEMVKVCAKAGQIILFDSRTVHCNVAPRSGFRMASYVSMQPRAGASKSDLEKRIKLFEAGRQTSHFCYGTWFKETAEHPKKKSYCYVEIAELNEVRKSLIGY